MGATKIRELNNTDAMKLAEVIPFLKQVIKDLSVIIDLYHYFQNSQKCLKNYLTNDLILS